MRVEDVVAGPGQHGLVLGRGITLRLVHGCDHFDGPDKRGRFQRSFFK